MSGKIPETVFGYRITHYKNIPFILRNGLYCSSSPRIDASYVNIGKTDIINKRERKQIDVSPYGRIHDYVSFYFGPKSPMLYSISKGNSNTTCQQTDVIYIVISLPKIIEAGLKFVFTTGQAIMQLSTQHNDIKELDQIAWDIIQDKYWFDDPPEYPDRARRRMAELLIHKHIPVNLIAGIGVMNEYMEKEISKMVNEVGLTLQVKTFRHWYY
ncbi:type II toxin-antitoxin system toxin DNA ADP-ribosyl transferase DarT [Filimonas effusa]|uniref:DUF4433 domain-containing protein n=1 Tax=Filimonas effusa TaxID=2508721 RepID=A0A4Q1D5T9_9BACT|nr:DUF4433 domain-containing protein [Filimonas effusa]RXK83768.1 DUF4433 domain-containing protein [Filimonas effusa]